MIFHHEDRDLVDDFVNANGHLFMSMHQRGVTAGDDFVSSPSDEVIIRSIRHRYLADVAVVILLLGRSTWSRRFVDWEIAAALGVDSADALPLVLCDLEPHLRHQTPLPPRLTVGGTPTVCRVAAFDSPKVIAEAVERAMTPECSQPEGVCIPGPLLRHDLR